MLGLIVLEVILVILVQLAVNLFCIWLFDYFKDTGEFYFTSLCPLSGQLNQRMNEGRIQGKDQEKGHISGQSVRGSAKDRSEGRCGKARRYQGYWMGISMMSVQKRWKTMDVKEDDSWSCWVWNGCCCALLLHIYRPFPPILSGPVSASPYPPPHALLHSDSANRLIFLEQWCQLFIPPLPSLFHLSDSDWLSLSPSVSITLCLCLSLLPVMRGLWLEILLMPLC